LQILLIPSERERRLHVEHDDDAKHKQQQQQLTRRFNSLGLFKPTMNSNIAHIGTEVYTAAPYYG